MSVSAYDFNVTQMRSATIDIVVERLMNINLLKRVLNCTDCCRPMSLLKDKMYVDGCCWRCLNRACQRNKLRVTIRTGSFFYGMRSSLVDIFSVIFCWTQEKPVKVVAEDFGLNKSTVIAIYSRLRDIIGEYCDSITPSLGGPGIVCQVDESLFSHKVKAHRGRPPQEQVWVFGIIDTSRSKDNLYLQVVGDRSANTLMPIISRVVRPKSTIYSDEWAGYKRLSQLGYVHKTVNHSKHFVDPESGVHTQNIESQWNVLKTRIKRMKGVRRVDLPQYLKEFMWRNAYPENSFLALIPLIALLN